MSHYETQERDRKGIILWATVLCACLVLIGYIATKPGPTHPEIPRHPELPRIAPPRDPKADRAEFFNKHVLPAIDIADKANKEAADRCLARVRDSFHKYRQGVNPFVEDVNSWGTRLGVVTRMPSDWWNESNDVRTFINEKLEKHLFSDKSLRDDIETAIAAFRRDIDANNAVLLSSVQAAVSSSEIPQLPKIEYGDFSRQVKESLEQHAENSAIDSTQNFIIVEIVSGVAGFTAEQLLVVVTARLTAMLATTTVASGGATVATTSVGGGGGTVTAGPLGTVIGIAGGLVVGIFIDWWMSKNFEAKLSTQLNQMIDGVESTVIKGDKQHPGLEQALRHTCNALRPAIGAALHKQITGGAI